MAELSDRDLLARLNDAARDERRATAAVVALLVEVDRRRLYLSEGYSSLFTYCTQVLRLSEHAAYGRIEAARAARKFPAILEFHHVVPFAAGGETSAANLELRCRPHNTYESEVWFGAQLPLVREDRPAFN